MRSIWSRNLKISAVDVLFSYCIVSISFFSVLNSLSMSFERFSVARSFSVIKLNSFSLRFWSGRMLNNSPLASCHDSFTSFNSLPCFRNESWSSSFACLSRSSSACILRTLSSIPRCLSFNIAFSSSYIRKLFSSLRVRSSRARILRSASSSCADICSMRICICAGE